MLTRKRLRDALNNDEAHYSIPAKDGAVMLFIGRKPVTVAELDVERLQKRQAGNAAEGGRSPAELAAYVNQARVAALKL